MYLRRILRYLTRRNVVTFNRAKQYRSLYSYHVDKTIFPSLIPTRISQYSSDTPLKCWNCKFPYKSELFCSKCKILQEPPENLNYFDIIGVEKSYNVTPTEIHNKYRELQKLLHPDKFSTKTEREKEISANLSSLVNKAYTILSHPLKRGFYLLELNNISVPEGTTNLDPEFLMEIMERNEEVENAKNNKEKIMQLMQENREMLEALTNQVTDAFNKEDIESAKASLIKMKYYDSIERRLKILKQDLGIVE